MTSAQKGRGVKKYPKFADKQFINLQTEGVQKLRKKSWTSYMEAPKPPNECIARDREWRIGVKRAPFTVILFRLTQERLLLATSAVKSARGNRAVSIPLNRELWIVIFFSVCEMRNCEWGNNSFDNSFLVPILVSIPGFQINCWKQPRN